MRNIFFKLAILAGLSIMLDSCIKVPQFDVMFKETQITVSENSSIVEVEFELPDGPRRQDVEISFKFGGTARLGTDYTTMEERFIIIIPNGLTSKSFMIDLLDNIEQDGPKSIVIAIILVVQNGNTIYQGAERQQLTIVIEDDDCSVYIGGEWEYTASYFMHSEGDTVSVGQDGNPLDVGVNPVFSGTVTIEDPDGTRNYYINDILIGMFSELEIVTPSPVLDACGTIAGPNDGSVKLMNTLPAYMNGVIENDNTIHIEFEYRDEEETGGGFGSAVLIRKE